MTVRLPENAGQHERCQTAKITDLVAEHKKLWDLTDASTWPSLDVKVFNLLEIDLTDHSMVRQPEKCVDRWYCTQSSLMMVLQSTGNSRPLA